MRKRTPDAKFSKLAKQATMDRLTLLPMDVLALVIDEMDLYSALALASTCRTMYGAVMPSAAVQFPSFPGRAALVKGDAEVLFHAVCPRADIVNRSVQSFLDSMNVRRLVMGRLEVLNLSGCRDLTDSAFATVSAACPRLKKLNLSGTGITGRCFVDVDWVDSNQSSMEWCMPCVETLDLSFCTLGCDFPRLWGQTATTRSLLLGKALPKLFPNVKMLSLQDCELDNDFCYAADIRASGRWASLQFLDVSRNAFLTSAGLASVRGGRFCRVDARAVTSSVSLTSILRPDCLHVYHTARCHINSRVAWTCADVCLFLEVALRSANAAATGASPVDSWSTDAIVAWLKRDYFVFDLHDYSNDPISETPCSKREVGFEAADDTGSGCAQTCNGRTVFSRAAFSDLLLNLPKFKRNMRSVQRSPAIDLTERQTFAVGDSVVAAFDVQRFIDDWAVKNADVARTQFTPVFARWLCWEFRTTDGRMLPKSAILRHVSVWDARVRQSTSNLRGRPLACKQRISEFLRGLLDLLKVNSVS